MNGKIDTYNKKAIWTNCFKTTVNLRCYSLDMIFDLLEFVLYNTYIRFNGNLNIDELKNRHL